MWTLHFRTLDYTRLAGMDSLATSIVRGRITASDAYAELDAILTGDRTYPRWLATVAYAGMVGSLAVLFAGDLFGGGYQLFVVAAGVTALIDRLGRMLNRRALPFFFQQVIGAAVITASAIGLHSSTLLPPDLSPALVVAAGRRRW